jgi:choline dehydrogenase-like flavoprotein
MRRELKKIGSYHTDLEANMPSRHLMGTCRMGSEPKTSVVNAFSRTHDVPNLFVVDGSNFVTSARQQPTATIQALAYRTADYAAQVARKGELS